MARHPTVPALLCSASSTVISMDPLLTSSSTTACCAPHHRLSVTGAQKYSSRYIRTIQIYFSRQTLVLWFRFTRAGNCRPCLTPCICNNIIMVVRLNTGPGPPSPPATCESGLSWTVTSSTHCALPQLTSLSAGSHSLLQHSAKIVIKTDQCNYKKNQSQPMQAGIIRGYYSSFPSKV